MPTPTARMHLGGLRQKFPITGDRCASRSTAGSMQRQRGSPVSGQISKGRGRSPFGRYW